MGKGSSKVGGGSASKKTPASSGVSFKDKSDLFAWIKAHYAPETTEWTRLPAPRGHVYVMPGSGREHSHLLGELNKANIKHVEIYGFTRRVGNTDLWIGPIDITLKNSQKTKAKAKTKTRTKKR